MSNEGSSSEGVDGDGRVMNDTTMPPPARGSAAQVGDVAPIPLRKIGQFGLSEWMRLLASSKDLAQRKGKPLRKIRWDEIRQHKSIHDGWIVLKNKVYFISPYMAYHPGGKVILMGVLGKDATTLFNKYHLWVNEDGLLQQLLIGYLDTTASDDSDEDEKKPSYLPQSITNDGFAIPTPHPPKR